MGVSLREITPENFRECVNLKVADEQENFVAPNVMSIAQSKIYATMTIRAVYAGDDLVGFTMFGLDTDDNRYYLVRLMIDARFQGRGYGKAALSEIIEAMKRIEDCGEIYLSFVDGNTAAERLYRSVGFDLTGETNSYGETIMRLAINNNAKHRSLI
jgi:diamine N-acetyltransferase